MLRACLQNSGSPGRILCALSVLFHSFISLTLSFSLSFLYFFPFPSFSTVPLCFLSGCTPSNCNSLQFKTQTILSVLNTFFLTFSFLPFLSSSLTALYFVQSFFKALSFVNRSTWDIPSRLRFVPSFLIPSLPYAHSLRTDTNV